MIISGWYESDFGAMTFEISCNSKAEFQKKLTQVVGDEWQGADGEAEDENGNCKNHYLEVIYDAIREIAKRQSQQQ